MEAEPSGTGANQAAASDTASSGTGEPSAPTQTIVMDLGNKKRRQIRRLRKGRGRLYRKIKEALDDMRDANHIDADAQAVIVIVRERKRKRRRKRGWAPSKMDMKL